VVCGEPRFEDAELDTLLNPTVLVEVLSASTEAYDRGAKFEQYRTLDPLMDYLLIAQDRCHVEHFFRQPENRWLLTEAGTLEETVHIASIECDLALAEVYEKVPLDRPADSAPGSFGSPNPLSFDA
jgi:Uma2 family endonuclease